MKHMRIISLLLVCAVLFSLLCIPVSAAETITFVPVLKNGKIYGAAFKTPQTVIRSLYSDRQIEIFDADGKRLNATDTTYFGTGFTIKLDGRLFYSAVVMGDVDGDGELTSMDYILVKRACLGTYALNSVQKQAAEAENGELRPINYIKVKRAFFNTYDINAQYTCDPYDPTGGDGWSDGWV